MAMVILEHFNYSKEVDLLKVLKMVLIHDLVETESGDTYCHDEVAKQDQIKKEKIAAEKVFSILPDDQAKEMFNLWSEYEKLDSKESKIAFTLDCNSTLTDDLFYRWKYLVGP